MSSKEFRHQYSNGIAILSMIILALLSGFLFKISPKTNINPEKLLSPHGKIPIQCLDVSSCEIDFNRCCLIKCLLLMKRHINYKMTKVHIILICNFQIILFTKYQGEHLEVFLRVYLFISQLQYLE